MTLDPEGNWADVEAEWAEYDISDLETGEASGLPQDTPTMAPERPEHSQGDVLTIGSLIAWLRGLVRT